MKNEKLPSKPAFDPEIPPREGFIFYRTFLRSVGLDEEQGKITPL